MNLFATFRLLRLGRLRIGVAQSLGRIKARRKERKARKRRDDSAIRRLVNQTTNHPDDVQNVAAYICNPPSARCRLAVGRGKFNKLYLYEQDYARVAGLATWRSRPQAVEITPENIRGLILVLERELERMPPGVFHKQQGC